MSHESAGVVDHSMDQFWEEATANEPTRSLSEGES
jgi:hypothetical protein